MALVESVELQGHMITQPVIPFLRDGSSVDTEVDVLDSEEYDTDLEDEKGTQILMLLLH